SASTLRRSRVLYTVPMPPWPKASSNKKRFFNKVPAPLPLSACSASSLALAKPEELLVVLARYWVFCVAAAAVGVLGAEAFGRAVAGLLSADWSLACIFLAGAKTVASSAAGCDFSASTVASSALGRAFLARLVASSALGADFLAITVACSAGFSGGRARRVLSSAGVGVLAESFLSDTQVFLFAPDIDYW